MTMIAHLPSRPALRRLFAGIAACGALLLVAPVASAQTVVVKMATLVPKGSSYYQALEELAAAWKKASNGQVELRLYPGGVAGDDADIVRKIRLGTLNSGFLTSAGMIEIERQVLMLQLPLLWENSAELDCGLARLAPRIEQAMAAKGFVVLGWTDGGFVRFFTKTPARTPDDLKGQKLFAWAGDDQYVELWKNAGFNPVPLPSTEIATALQTGLVTAVPTPVNAALLLQFYNHAKNMTELDWSPLMGAIVVSRQVWDKVPEAQRPALAKAAQETTQRFRDLARQSLPKDVEAMQKGGLNVVKLDAAARQQWARLMDTVYPRLRDRFIPGDQIDLAIRTRDECRQAAKAGGR